MSEFYTFQKPENDVLQTVIGIAVQKLHIGLGTWQPFLIYENYQIPTHS
jgi:hypothetical protein